MSFVFLDPAVKGWKVDPSSGSGESGVILAFRKDGDEVLFAPCEGGENRYRRPCEWIPVTLFAPDTSELTVPDDEEDDGGGFGGVGEDEPSPRDTTVRIRRRPSP